MTDESGKLVIHKTIEKLNQKIINQENKIKELNKELHIYNKYNTGRLLIKIASLEKRCKELSAQNSMLRQRFIDFRQREKTVVHNDTKRLKWLFCEDNLDAHVSLPRNCWENTTSYRKAIDAAMNKGENNDTEN